MPRTSPSELTISVTTRPQPPFRFTRRRKAVSVMPAMGASATGCARLIWPIFMGGRRPVKTAAAGGRGRSRSRPAAGVLRAHLLVVHVLQVLVLPLDER